MSKKKRFLITPLDWGLGHATRCIPIIQNLLDLGVEVIIASSGDASRLLDHEFPQLKHLLLPTYDIRYPSKNMIWNIGYQSPKLLQVVRKEYKRIKRICKSYPIDAIISDNRFGCYHKQIPSVFITHQLQPIIPGKQLQWWGQKVNKYFINQFQACWVPDTEGPNNLSGKLSQKLPGSKTPITYIGPLSRMQKLDTTINYEVIAILSGPEPQRTYLEEQLMPQLKRLGKPALVVQGKTDHFVESFQDGIKVVSFLTSSALEASIAASRYIICRSGYSSIMDLATLYKKAILIPTPGQTEQIYLAQKLEAEKVFPMQYQDQIDLSDAFRKIESYSGFHLKQNDPYRLRETLQQFILSL